MFLCSSWTSLLRRSYHLLYADGTAAIGLHWRAVYSGQARPHEPSYSPVSSSPIDENQSATFLISSSVSSVAIGVIISCSRWPLR